MTDLQNWQFCHSVVHRRRTETNHSLTCCTFIQILKSPMYDEGKTLVWLRWRKNQELVWKRGLIKSVREWVSYAVSQRWPSSARLIRLADVTNSLAPHGGEFRWAYRRHLWDYPLRDVTLYSNSGAKVASVTLKYAVYSFLSVAISLTNLSESQFVHLFSVQWALLTPALQMQQIF